MVSACKARMEAIATRALLAALVVVGLLGIGAGPAAALEAWDGRLQAHGFYEMQFRALSADYAESWDASAWYHIFNVELELDMVQDTIGPLDLLSAYARIEGRYNCIYSDGCGIFQQMRAYGDDSRRLPRRLSNGNDIIHAGTIRVGPQGRLSGTNTNPVPFRKLNGFTGLAATPAQFRVMREDTECPGTSPPLTPGQGCGGIDPNTTNYDPGKVPVQFLGSDRIKAFDYVFRDYLDYRFTQINAIGGSNDGLPVQILGPWLPKNRIGTIGLLADTVNPFDNTRVNPVTLQKGNGAKPFRPIPIFDEDDPQAARALNGQTINSEYYIGLGSGAGTRADPLGTYAILGNQKAPSRATARGLYAPSLPLRDVIQSGRLDEHKFNWDETERAFNRGASQEQTGELKELYIDAELFDSRLWLRLGKQSIVWGKTELFRTTDQFNPQDLALASLPTLEESRINLWAVRAVYSFYEVGPFSDVRAELAFNYDEFQPADLGSCGEPYTVNLVCQLTFGSLAHGLTGVGIAGFDRPDDPWHGLEGWEIGGRVEWRWDRFSFAVTDFYGYSDLPYVERISTYQRNVDPRTGRPRFYGAAQRFAYGSRNAVNCNLDKFETTTGAFDRADTITFAGDDREGCLSPGPTNRRRNQPTAHPAFPTTGPIGGFTEPGAPATGGRVAIANGYDAYLGDAKLLQDARDAINCDKAALDAYDPKAANPRLNPCDDLQSFAINFQNFDVNRNSLSAHHANLTIFNFICATTVGFISLDPSACAQTVFGSTQPATSDSSILVSNVISGVLGGRADVNNTLISVERDPGEPPLLPFALPLVRLHGDWQAEDTNGTTNLGDIRATVDYRTNPFFQSTAGAMPNDPFPVGGDDGFGNVITEPLRVIRSREIESYRCTSDDSSPFGLLRAPECGGFVQRNNGTLARARGNTGAALSPEQEALLGCGPFWGTNCDDSGLDLLNAEASALLQSFVGFESVGLPCSNVNSLNPNDAVSQQGVNICDLIPKRFGKKIGDPGSWADEYRTDGRIVGKDGYLLCRDQNGAPVLRTDPACRTQAIGAFNQAKYRDGYFQVRASQPGTLPWALVNNPALCTTRDIGGPAGVEGVLPGCRSKWDSDFSDRGNVTGNVYQFLSTLAPADQLTLDPRSRLNVGGGPAAYDLSLPSCPYSAGDPNADALAQTDPSCWRGAWVQTVDGDPDYLGMTISTPGSGNPVLAMPRYFNPSNPARGFAFDALNPLNATTCGYNGGGLNGNWRSSGADAVAGGPSLGVIENPTCSVVKQGVGAGHPFTGEAFANEFAGLSFNFMMLVVGFSDSFQNGVESVRRYIASRGLSGARGDAAVAEFMFSGTEAVWLDSVPLFEDVNGDRKFEDSGRFIGREHCSVVTPQYCDIVQDIFAVAGVKRNDVRAGGNGRFGRRTFQWHSGGEAVIRYAKRNVLGLSTDFAEDVTKSNWSVEFTWIEGQPQGDNGQLDGISYSDELNLTVSVDRPTFINFLNDGRTFFINSQWFFQYKPGHEKSFTAAGPVNVLATLTAFTGYYQDRLNPSITFVYDFQSVSGAVLPSVQFRFSESFSATVGALLFWGEAVTTDMPVNEIGPAAARAGPRAYKDAVDRGLALVRDRDELFLTIRYTF